MIEDILFKIGGTLFSLLMAFGGVAFLCGFEKIAWQILERTWK